MDPRSHRAASGFRSLDMRIGTIGSTRTIRRSDSTNLGPGSSRGSGASARGPSCSATGGPGRRPNIGASRHLRTRGPRVLSRSGGLSLVGTNETLPIDRLRRGDMTRVTGFPRSHMGTVELLVSRASALGVAPLPTPRDIQVSDALSGDHTGQLVAIAGLIRPSQSAHPGSTRTTPSIRRLRCANCNSLD